MHTQVSMPEFSLAEQGILPGVLMVTGRKYRSGERLLLINSRYLQ